MPPDFPNVVSLAVPLFMVTMAIEWTYGAVTGRVRFNTRDTAASLSMGVGNLVIDAMFGVLAFGVLMALYEWRWMTWGVTPWAVAGAFVLDDLRYYVHHRLSHECRWLWWAHVTHHSSQHYNLSTALRQEWAGPFNLAFLLYTPLVVCLGIHPLTLAFVGGLNLVYQYWIHTEAIRRFPAPIEWVMNTPSHHRVHHGRNPRYLDANYAGVFIVWDRLFGTFVPEEDEEPVRYGLVKNIGTYHPFRIGFHELIAIVVDACQPGITWGQRLRYVFGRPGYSHDGSRKTAPMIQAEWRAQQVHPPHAPPERMG